MFEDLLSALQRLDRRLDRAVSEARTIYGTQADTDPYRGLHIDDNEVERLLAREPGIPLFAKSAETSEAPSPASRLQQLQQAFNLSPFDLDVILIALAPEIDLRYERLYAYLQDDVTRKHPTVDLALNLLCRSPQAKLLQQGHFAPNAPLIESSLLHLIPDPQQIHPPLLAHSLKLDRQIVRFLLRQGGLKPRLASFCQAIAPTTTLDRLPLSEEIEPALTQLTQQACQTHQPLHLYFYGQDDALKRQTAEALARLANKPLLIADCTRLPNSPEECERALQLLLRETLLVDALLYLENCDRTSGEARSTFPQRLLQQLRGIVILAGKQPWISDANLPGHVIPIPFPLPNFAQRRRCWQASLAAEKITLDDGELDALADRFRLSAERITDAAIMARHLALWTAARSPQFPTQPVQPTPNQLFAAARAQSDRHLSGLARKIEPKYVWEDIVLQPERLAQLQAICNQVKSRHIVYSKWGFEGKLSLGKGLNALFSGSPGTGKTMAAEVIARELQLDLYKIDLSQVVSKYIGETEKNLDRIFTAAENANAILLFDEADALFGKRSEVKDARDRYANIEVAYLLQKMEEYEGITILTSNFRQNLDEAFTRRIRFIVEFPFPEAEDRLKIWQSIWPAETPLATDIDFPRLARQFKLAGGNIRNIALAAAFLAVEDGQWVGTSHLLQATKWEFQKMGRLINEEEFLGFAGSQ